MVRITYIITYEDFSIEITFNDGLRKTINMKPFIGYDNLTLPLNNYSYFCKVRICENGRGIFWPNQFDFCPDYLHDFVN